MLEVTNNQRLRKNQIGPVINKFMRFLDSLTVELSRLRQLARLFDFSPISYFQKA